MNFELIRQNKAAMRLHTVMCIMFIIMYTLAAVTGSASMVNAIALDVILAGGWIAIKLLLAKKKDSASVKYVMFVTFGIFYTGLMFSESLSVIYAIVIPAMILTTIFYDIKYSLVVAISSLIVNIAHLIYSVAVVKDPVGMAEGVTGVVIIALAGAFSVISSSFIKNFNDEKMAVVKREEERQKENSEKLLEIGQIMSADIEESVAKMDALKTSISDTQTGMSEINNGITDTTNAVQEQLRMTSDIQNQIQLVTDTAGTISASIDHSSEIIADSMNIMRTMLEDAKASEMAGEDVKSSLLQLHENTKSMRNIVSMINEVAEQTSLLALNASIEAARAGEAGRGFAVVAGEVNNLSVQTQTATTEISRLIDDIGSQVEAVVDKTEVLLKNNAKQNESADATHAKLVEVMDCSNAIDSESTKLSDAVTVLHKANAEIVNNISNVSSVSEEVSAQANVSYEEATKNLTVMDEVMEIFNRLNESAEELNNL